MGRPPHLLAAPCDGLPILAQSRVIDAFEDEPRIGVREEPTAGRLRLAVDRPHDVAGSASRQVNDPCLEPDPSAIGSELPPIPGNDILIGQPPDSTAASARADCVIARCPLDASVSGWSGPKSWLRASRATAGMALALRRPRTKQPDGQSWHHSPVRPWAPSSAPRSTGQGRTTRRGGWPGRP